MFITVKAAQGFSGPALRRRTCVILGAAFIAVSVTVAAAFEFRTTYFQSQLLSHWASDLTYAVQRGPNDTVRFPLGGPQDKRLGYSRLPAFIESLKANDFEIVRQSVPSTALEEFTARHGYAIYREKEFAGLSLRDRNGTPFYKTNFPQRLFGNFNAIPPL